MENEKSENVQQNTKETSGTTVLLHKKYTYSSKWSAGSGFFISTDKIATNIHVIAGSTKVTAKCVDTETVYAIEGIIAFDDKNDLAVLKVTAKEVPFTLGNSDTVRIGDTVHAIGYPKAQESSTKGTVSAIRNNGKLIELNIPDAGPGYSGAPVLNNKGEVIAILYQGTDEFGDAIPVNRLKELLTGTGQIEPDDSSVYPGVRSWISTLFRSKSKLEPVSTEVSPPKLESAASLPVESLKTWQKRPRIRAYIKDSQGDDKFEKGNYKGAIADYNKAIKYNPDRTIVYNVRGIAKGKLGDFKGSIGDFDNAIRLNPEYAGAYNNRGAAKADLGDLERAIEDFDQAIRLKPEYAGAYKNRGIAKGDLGDFEGAIDDYDHVIKLNPEDIYTYNNRGIAKDYLDDVRGAIDDYDNAIRINPKYAGTYNNRALAKRKLGDFEGAIEDFDHAIKLKP